MSRRPVPAPGARSPAHRWPDALLGALVVASALLQSLVAPAACWPWAAAWCAAAAGLAAGVVARAPARAEDRAAAQPALDRRLLTLAVAAVPVLATLVA